MLNQTGVQGSAQRQNGIVEIVSAVVQGVRAGAICSALPHTQIGTLHSLQHEREIFSPMLGIMLR